jgi:hypothetical protein
LREFSYKYSGALHLFLNCVNFPTNIPVRCTSFLIARIFLQIFRCAAPYMLETKQQSASVVILLWRRSCEIFVEINSTRAKKSAGHRNILNICASFNCVL